MGGNAIDRARRVSTEEFHEKIKFITGQRYLVIEPQEGNVASPANKYTVYQGSTIVSYRNKPDFGDIDIVLDDRVSVVQLFDRFRPRKCAINGNIFSMAYDGIQVDFILTPERYIESTLDYFAYNDLGALLGRLYRTLGFKYGNKGLVYSVYERNNRLEDIEVTKDFPFILTALGLSESRYRQGFDELEDIFEYVTTSPIFTPSMFYYENNPGKDRSRDKKRKTYVAFLEWLERKQFPEKDPVSLAKLRHETNDHIHFLFPEVKEREVKLFKDREEDNAFRNRFNGNVVRDITKLEEGALKSFMKYFREKYSREELTNLDDSVLHERIGSEYQTWCNLPETNLVRDQS